MHGRLYSDRRHCGAQSQGKERRKRSVVGPVTSVRFCQPPRNTETAIHSHTKKATARQMDGDDYWQSPSVVVLLDSPSDTWPSKHGRFIWRLRSYMILGPRGLNEEVVQMQELLMNQIYKIKPKNSLDPRNAKAGAHQRSRRHHLHCLPVSWHLLKRLPSFTRSI